MFDTVHAQCKFLIQSDQVNREKEPVEQSEDNS